MPSLRRTFSDSYSNPRSSPYPSTLSLSAAAAGALNAHNGSGSMRMRRSASNSDTSSRRVLADIEWWRVTPGQQSEPDENAPAPEEDSFVTTTNQDEESPAFFHEVLAVPAAPTTTPSILSDDSFSTLDAGFVLDEGVFSTSDASQGASSLTSPFASLSIVDGMPQTPPRSRSVSASSSTETSPETSPRTPATHTMRLLNDRLSELQQQQSFLGLDLGFDTSMDFGRSEFSDIAIGGGCSSDAALPTSMPGCSPTGTFGAMRLLRSTSFGAFETPGHSNASDDRFGDVLFV